MLMSDLIHRSLACKAHLNMSIENALYQFITITIILAIIVSLNSHIKRFQSDSFGAKTLMYKVKGYLAEGKKNVSHLIFFL